MKKLIINADDLGIHEAVNLGISCGHNKGCITSASLMAVGGAFNDALELISQNPQLGIGVHLTLNVGEKPVSDPAIIPTIVNKEGRFLNEYPQFLKQMLCGRVKLAEIRTELSAQIIKLINNGIEVTHIDSHQHLHVFPGIIEVALDLAKEFNIKAIRIPSEPYMFTGGYPLKIIRFFSRGGLTLLANRARYKAMKKGIMVPDNFFGMLAGGNLEEKYLLNILAGLPEGISEIMMHPASSDCLLNDVYNWKYNWEGELAAVTGDKIKDMLDKGGIKLISFKELGYA